MKLEVGRIVSTGAVGNAFLTKPSLGELDRGSRKKGNKGSARLFWKEGKPENRGESEDCPLMPRAYGLGVFGCTDGDHLIPTAD
jgi:hypothetical protein